MSGSSTDPSRGSRLSAGGVSRVLVATPTAMLEQTAKSSGLLAELQKLYVNFRSKLGMVATWQISTMNSTRLSPVSDR
jgi:hypothetical protein